MNLCAYCNKQAVPPHMDHVVPISRGGPDDPTNKVLSCAACNLSKGARLPSEWLESPPALVSEIERTVILRVGNKDPRFKGGQAEPGPIGATLPGVGAVLEWRLGLSPADLALPLVILQAALSPDHRINGPAASYIFQKCTTSTERQFLLGLFCRKDGQYIVEQFDDTRGVLYCRQGEFRFNVCRGYDVRDDEWECNCSDAECQHEAPSLGTLSFMLMSVSADGEEFDLEDNLPSVVIDLSQERRTSAQLRALSSAIRPHHQAILRFDSAEVNTNPAICFDDAVRELRNIHSHVARIYRSGFRARGLAIQRVEPELKLIEAAE